MKEFFEDTKFRPDSLSAIAQCNAIIEDYQRQLYYQLVSRDAEVQ